MYARWFAAVIGLVFVSSLYAAEVEVIVDSAPLKVGDQVIATVQRRQRLHLLQTKGAWLAVSIREGDRELRGWLLADKIRQVVDPKFETATAPDAPVDFRIDADWVQVCASEDDERRLLFLFLKLKNELLDPAKFSVDEVRLLIDEQSLSAVRMPAERENNPREASDGFDAFLAEFDFRGRRGFGAPFSARTMIPLPAAADPGAPRQTAVLGPAAPPDAPPFKAANCLQDADLVADGQIKGWLCFDLEPIAEALATPAGLSEKNFQLQLSVAEETLHFDLTANENRKLGAIVRSSKYEPSVSVVEISPNVNSLNVGSLRKIVEAVSQVESRFLLVFRPGELFVEEFAERQWGKSYADAPSRFCAVAPPNSASGPGWGRRFGVFGSITADSEEIGALLVLDARKEAAAVLLPYLASEAEATRAAAASVLSSHLAEPEVAERLVAAASDKAPQVRAAAIAALTTRGWNTRLWNTRMWRALRWNKAMLNIQSGNTLAPWPAESPAARAILKALRDPAAPVRQAALVAAELDWQGFEEDCLRLLDDEDESLRLAACMRLGAAKSRAAVDRLKKLQAGIDKQLAAEATTSLESMGELSALDAALARLKYGHPDEDKDYDIVVKANDRRAVPVLLSLLSGERRHSRDAARALGEMRASEAFDPLLAKIQPGEMYQPYVLALGKLGDSRAVAPIRELLKQSGDEIDVAAYEALFMLNEPGVFEELADALKKRTKNGPSKPRTREVFGRNARFFGASNDDKDRDGIDDALGLLARYGDDRAIGIIEPYLDREEYCKAAAQSLTMITTPLAVVGIESRLKSADYAFGVEVLHGLQSDPKWLRSSLGKSLLRAAANSENEATKKAAAELLEKFEEEPDPAA